MKKYICECGKEFDNSQKFNGHKSHCEIHLKHAHKWSNYLEREKNRKQKVRNCYKLKREKWQEEQDKIDSLELLKWISEQHRCEKCGKVMTEKYCSGRFCSPSCAHSHQKTAEQKIKIGQSVKLTKSKPESRERRKKAHDSLVEKYYENPTLCMWCGSPLTFKRRDRKVCSKECQDKLNQEYKIKLCAERGTNLCGKGKRGYYKGYYCQSSWELAYVIYCLEHDIKIRRNKDRFSYKLDKIERSYFPDFILPDNTYVEIKGYYDKKTREKEKQFPKDKKLIILKKEEMQPILAYVKEKYGDNFTSLYEVNFAKK